MFKEVLKTLLLTKFTLHYYFTIIDLLRKTFVSKFAIGKWTFYMDFHPIVFTWVRRIRGGKFEFQFDFITSLKATKVLIVSLLTKWVKFERLNKGATVPSK